MVFATASDRSLRGLLRGSFSITQRPQPLPGDLRIGWGVALLILVLGASRGQRASLQKLHFLAHLSRTRTTREQTLGVLHRTVPPAMLSVRVEPWVNRATAFAIGEGLAVLRDGKAVSLSDNGRTLYKSLIGLPVLEEEKRFLGEVGPRATEKVIEKIMKMEPF
jgi:hypothetical protein